MTVYVVRYDHSDYGQGLVGVFAELEGARAAVREDCNIRNAYPESFTKAWPGALEPFLLLDVTHVTQDTAPVYGFLEHYDDGADNTWTIHVEEVKQ